MYSSVFEQAVLLIGAGAACLAAIFAILSYFRPHQPADFLTATGAAQDAVAGLVGIEGGVVSGVFNLESSGVEAPDWRPRHDEHYHEA